MKNLKLLMISVALGGLGLTGCSDDDVSVPSITPTAYVVGSPDGATSRLVVPARVDVVYKFVIKSSAPLKKIELWTREGLGVNMDESSQVTTYKFTDTTANEYVVMDTIKALDNDVSYSVYVEDINSNFSSARADLYLDVMKYNASLTDGAQAANTPTFLNLAWGRTLFIANTIGDPTGVDLGFTYLENTDYKACMVSFDEYYKTGNYAMVVNDLNPSVDLRDATGLMTKENLFDEVAKASDMKTFYDNAKVYSTILDFSEGKVASALEEGDVIAFLTEDGRYGLLKVKEIDRKNEDVANNQTINFDLIIDKKL